MAITGTFNADFSQFSTAVESADVKLKGFETSSTKVESALSRMTNSFSGTKVIQEGALIVEAVERIGGTSKLTEAELARLGASAAEAAAKMKAMGLDVPDGLSKIAKEAKEADTAHKSMTDTVKDLAIGFAAMFTARAAFNFVKDIVEDASALKDLSAQTHINVEDLQVLAGSMSEFGVDTQELGKGLFTLSRKVAGGDESVARALNLMGLSLKDVAGLEGEQLFLKMEHGLSTLQGSLRDTAATDLFGAKLGAAMAGASEGIDESVAKARQLNSVMSKESVDALDTFGESIERANRNLGAIAANLIGPVAEGFNVVNDAVNKGAGFWATAWAMTKDMLATNTLMGASTSNLAKLLDDLNQKTDMAAQKTREAAAAAGQHKQALDEQGQAARFMAALEEDASVKLTAAQVTNLAHLKEIGALNLQNAAAIGVSSTQFNKYTAEVAAAAEQHKKMADAMTEINSAGTTWQTTLAGINGEVVNAVRGYLDAGVSQNALATAYGLTATQVKAITLFMKEQVDQQKINDQAVMETTKLWDEFDANRISHGGTATDVQIAQVKRWADDLTAKMVKAKADTTDFYDALAAVSKSRIDSILVDWDAIGKNSKDVLQQTADKARATFDFMLEHSDRFSSETIRKFEDTAIAAQKAADEWDTAVTTATEDMTNKVTTATDKMSQSFGSLATASEKALSVQVNGPINWTEYTKSLNDALMHVGRVDWGGPQQTLPKGFAGGSGGYRDFGAGTPVTLHGIEKVTPYGAGNEGGITVNNVFHLVDTASNLAQQVSDILTRSVMSGQRMATA